MAYEPIAVKPSLPTGRQRYSRSGDQRYKGRDVRGPTGGTPALLEF